jgi:hypothetical protein
VTVSGSPACTRCGRPRQEDDSGLGWSLARRPRPTGAAARATEQQPVTVLCPECLRVAVRDVEARLDP